MAAPVRSQSSAQGFPQIPAEFVDERRLITQPWYQLLLSLWNRTGAGQGGSISPTGAISAFAALIPPDGWIVCDGSAVSRTIYAALFGIIGTTWGAGDHSTTFNIPDLRGRSLIGVSGSHLIASTGGSENVNLSVSQLPSHSHTVTDPGHVHTALTATSVGTTGTDPGSSTAGNTGSSVTGITIGNTGGGDPVNILNPYAAIIWIIKT